MTNDPSDAARLEHAQARAVVMIRVAHVDMYVSRAEADRLERAEAVLESLGLSPLPDAEIERLADQNLLSPLPGFRL